MNQSSTAPSDLFLLLNILLLNAMVNINRHDQDTLQEWTKTRVAVEVLHYVGVRECIHFVLTAPSNIEPLLFGNLGWCAPAICLSRIQP